MLNFLKTTFTDADSEDITQERYVEQSVTWHGKRAVIENQNYQIDRMWKQNYILVNIIADGYDQKRFLEHVVKVKNTTPNVDYFTRDEIKKVVRSFKELVASGDSEMNRSSSILNDSAANMFDEALQRRRSSSVMRRRNTGTAEDTILSRNMGCACIVAGVNQYITRKYAGLTKDQSMMITIDTFPMKWRVKRLDSDFQILRDFLLRTYPQVVIPPLPAPKTKRQQPRQLVKRQQYYQRFLNAVLRSQVLKTSKFLVAFLQETNQEQFNLKLLTIEEEVGPRNIYEFRTITGEIEVERRRKATKFCDQMGSFTKQYHKISKYIARRAKDLQARSHELADDYFAIGAEINHFAELMKLTEIPQAVKFYKRLGDLIIRNGDHTIRSGELLNQNLAAWFKYLRQESKSYEEAHWLREESLSRYNAQRIDLNKRKERLFRRKDVTEWGCTTDSLRPAMDTLNDAEAAFGYMLPNATKQVNYLGEESSFFTSQCYKETRRTTMINYTMAREHFIDMGEQVHKHIYDINLAWGQFLDFYSDLNNARKSAEDSFVDRTYIGEELQEPDESPLTNDDLVDDFDQREDRENENKNNNFFDAFDDGYSDASSARGSISGNRQSAATQQITSSAQGGGSQNMLGELQREISLEENSQTAPLLPKNDQAAPDKEVLKIEPDTDSKLIVEEQKQE